MCSYDGGSQSLTEDGAVLMLTKWDAGSLLFARVILVQRRDGPGRLSDYGDDDDDDDLCVCSSLL